MTGPHDPTTSLPYLTQDAPGIGGVIKQLDADFMVEEIPAYPASGVGSHLYLMIEKRGLTTSAAIRLIARALRKKPQDFGYAGLKDAHGVTRQMISIEHVDSGEIEAVDIPRVKILSTTRHTNKIKLGHLAGNRFEIRIRDTVDHPLELARPILDCLHNRGVPNYFGPQRFGARGDNADVGRAVLSNNYDEAIAIMLGRPTCVDHGPPEQARRLFDEGKYDEAAAAWSHRFPQQARLCRVHRSSGGKSEKTWRAVDRSLQLLFLSAVQSELFNRVLAERIECPDRLVTGDVAWKHANGACFSVDDAAAEQPRCDRFEISPSGPLFGRKMKEARHEAGAVELRIVQESGLTLEQFTSWSGRGVRGARRPLRVPLGHLEYGADGDDRGPYFRLQFELPPGAYATAVTRELCKA